MIKNIIARNIQKEALTQHHLLGIETKIFS